MPNMKIYVDETLPEASVTSLKSALLPIREMLCVELKVDTSGCQFAVLRVAGLSDQPQVNVELMILPKPDRTQETIRDVCRKLREMVAEASGLRVAVRAAALDPQTYIALK
ncbi:hypothetical protein J2046_005865 [Rhizobium petrolearium]|uniref:hypothetical protein n=1 Tax=Neorhizobium petrolearium TaxID=515361 RepID=UPI001AE40F7E|nr:hypothetical protein [Neorhizobium petrolearium]MBP1847581.1 hypothetical protein [Neorhizobium petrolearium]